MKIDYLSLKAINGRYIGEIEEAVRQTMESGWYLLGERVRCFEQAYAEYIGSRHCVACGNGLDALKLMLMGEMVLGKLHKGDEIIVPANTYIATILAITEVGLTPVLVEPSPQTLQIDENQISTHITPHTRAIMLVHLYGDCAMTPAIEQLAREYGLLIFEDNAQAHGCEYADAQGKTRKTGSLGEAAAHSFYPGKNLGALGDAGAVTTNNAALAQAVRALANYGSSQKYVFPYRGLNSRMDEVQAAVLSIKLSYLDGDNSRRIETARKMCQGIDNSHVKMPWREVFLSQEHRGNVVHIFPILSDKRDALQTYLKEQGIGTMIHYPIPPHKQQCYQAWNALSLPITERIHAEELSLPCNPCMTEEETQYVIDMVNSF